MSCMTINYIIIYNVHVLLFIIFLHNVKRF